MLRFAFSRVAIRFRCQTLTADYPLNKIPVKGRDERAYKDASRIFDKLRALDSDFVSQGWLFIRVFARAMPQPEDWQ